MRDSTIFYRSFYEAIKELSPELQAQVYSAIFEYALNFKETELTGLAKTVFTLVKPQLDANLKRYASGTAPKQKRNGSESEAKVKRNVSETEANNKRKRSETEANVNDNDNVNDNVNLNLNVNENVNANKFVKPQPKEVYDYMTELNQAAGNRWNESKVRMEAQNFHDFYESKGWVIGKNKMKDLKATIRRWMNNNKQTNNTNNNEQRIAEHIAKHSDNPHYLNLFPNLNKATTTH
jgi:hypothetical protein